MTDLIRKPPMTKHEAPFVADDLSEAWSMGYNAAIAAMEADALAADARAEALKEAADAWAAYKAANTTIAHWEAVARLDAALITEKQP